MLIHPVEPLTRLTLFSSAEHVKPFLAGIEDSYCTSAEHRGNVRLWPNPSASIYRSSASAGRKQQTASSPRSNEKGKLGRPLRSAGARRKAKPVAARKMVSAPGVFSPPRPHSAATIDRMKAAQKKREEPVKSVWVRTFEAEDALYIVIRAKRQRIPEVNVLGPPVKIDLAEEIECPGCLSNSTDLVHHSSHCPVYKATLHR